MRFRFVWIGETKNEHIRGLLQDYMRRLTRFASCKVIELREGAGGSERNILQDESKRIMASLRPDAHVVLLDTQGEEWSSQDLASKLEKWQINGVREVTFIIGGHLGVAPEIKERANMRWCLSRLTLTHELARVLLVEQLYRAYTIVRGLPYHK